MEMGWNGKGRLRDEGVVVVGINALPRVHTRFTLFYHIARNCNRNPKCAICSLNHETRDCERKQGPVKKTATCCNCGGDHAASFRGCPKYPDLGNARSYADALTGKTQDNTNINKNNNNNSQTQQLNSLKTAILKELEVESLSQLIDQYSRILKKLKEIKDVGEKIIYFLTAISEDCRSSENRDEEMRCSETPERSSAPPPPSDQ